MEEMEQKSAELVRKEETMTGLTAAEGMLADVRAELSAPNTLCVPIGQLAALGGGVASMLPALRTVTQSTSFPVEGLYRCANAGVGDTLKMAKDGTSWGALKTADGASKMAKFQQVGGISGTATTVLPIDPATMMVAVVLFSIEQKLGNIEETGRKILSFLENEKKAEIEANMETLNEMISDYKFNWDNERILAGNYNKVMDIKDTARKHMLSYQKSMTVQLQSQKPQIKVQAAMQELQTNFKYYRLSLYTFSMASLLKIMLSGNYREDYIRSIREEVEKLSIQYRELYGRCYTYLEKKSHSGLGTGVLKAVGTTSNAAGRLLGSIPVVKEGPADEFLRESGERMQAKAQQMEENMLEGFKAVRSPGTHVFLEKMEELIRIYNHTREICFDRENIYLLGD